MKVALVQEQADVARGGAETSTVEMARNLAALELDVTVVCSEPRHEGTAAGRHERIRALSAGAGPDSPGWPIASAVGDTNQLDIPGHPDNMSPAANFHTIPVAGASRLSRTINFIADADRFCRDERFDIIHAVTPCFSCNVYQPRGGTYVETVSRSVARAGSPLARLVKRLGRRFNRRQRFLLLAEREILSDPVPPHVAAVSEYVARQVATAFPDFPSERLRVVFNGVAIKPLGPECVGPERAVMRKWFGVDDQTPVVLFVAHNFKLKGLAELLRALSRLRQARWQLSVVGRGDPGPYKRLARCLDIASRVKFHGPIENVRSLYYGADLLAHPTWYDPCSRVVLEALVCGLPVVTTRFNGAAEVIEGGRHGAVIDSPHDIAALASAIEQSLAPDIRAACRADADRLRNQLSMARHARELKSLYEQVVKS